MKYPLSLMKYPLSLQFLLCMRVIDYVVGPIESDEGLQTAFACNNNKRIEVDTVYVDVD